MPPTPRWPEQRVASPGRQPQTDPRVGDRLHKYYSRHKAVLVLLRVWTAPEILRLFKNRDRR